MHSSSSVKVDESINKLYNSCRVCSSILGLGNYLDGLGQDLSQQWGSIDWATNNFLRKKKPIAVNSNNPFFSIGRMVVSGSLPLGLEDGWTPDY